MPPVSAAQSKAMFAAAAGHSALGIPEGVGKESIGKDEAPQLAAGVIFVAPDGAVLLLCRSAQETNYGGHWALPGGKGEEGETPWKIVCRETCEEIGPGTEHAWLGEPTVVDEVVTPTGMVFTTFVQPVRYRFTPEIDAEHCGYVWVKADRLPSPMHPQVARVLGMLFPEIAEAEIAEGDDVEPTKMEKRLARLIERRSGGAIDSIAMDRATVRSKDADGHMRVERTPITRAVVSPYYGREIPQWQTLNLDPERVYQVYRDAEELEKGAKTFEGKPVLSDHIASSADNHPKLATVGAVGSPVEMVGDTLYAPLTIWDQSAIDEIESGEKKNLSCSYRYQYDPTPGTAPNGMPFDGSMKGISANHVALVLEPRVPGSMVADNMPAGLAATIPNSAAPAGGVKRAPAHDDKETEMSKAKDSRARDEGLMERLKGSLSAEDYKAVDEMLTAGKANDEEDDDAKKKADDEAAEEAKKKAEDEEAEAKKKAEDEDDDDDKADDESVSKEAMDAAIQSSVSSAVANERKHQAAIREAERFVRPWVGDLAVAYDSAGDVYKAAIEANGRSVKDVHPSAYRTILEMIPKPGQQNRQPARLAMDSAKSNGFAERYGDAARISVSLPR